MNKILENNIVLNKDTHEYRLLSEPELTFTSVTTFVDSFFEGFDSLKIATNLVQNHPRYAGCTVESLIAKWDEARDHGTLVHDEIENWEGTDPGSVGFHAFTGDPDRHTILRKVYDMDGRHIEQWLDFDEKYFVQQDTFAGVDPDEEYMDVDQEGDPVLTENGEVTLHHVYLRTVRLPH